jgi:hypothetical protein
MGIDSGIGEGRDVQVAGRVFSPVYVEVHIIVFVIE